jgi:hypothetical protein
MEWSAFVEVWLPRAAALAGLALLAHSLVGLVAIWAALGRPHWFIRLAVLGGVLSLGLPIRAYDLVLIFATQSLVVLVPLWLDRWRTERIASRAGSSDRQSPCPRRPQFSILDLLLATVVVAAVLAFAVRVPGNVWEVWSENLLLFLFAPTTLPLPGYPFVWTPAAPWIVFGCVAAFFGLSTLVAAWAALGKRRLWLRVMGLCLVPSSLLMAAWLALARESEWLRRAHREDELPKPTPCTQSKRRAVARYVARITLAVLSLTVLLPLGWVYHALIPTTPILETTLPADNGYDALVRAGRSLRDADMLDADTATESELGEVVHPGAKSVAAARAALGRPCQVPVDYSLSLTLSRLDALQDLRALARAFEAEGKLAEKEGRTDDAVTSYCDTIRLGQAASRGGLLVDALYGLAIEGTGVWPLRDLRTKLMPDQCRELIAFLQSVDADREPFDEIMRRNRAWECRALGWQGALSTITEPESASAAFDDDGAAAQARMRLLVCELAIQMYRAELGKAPQRLEDLVPDYLAAVPQDPFSEGPLIYRRTSTGYVLYSVGANRQDDVGRRGSNYVGSSGDLLLDDAPTDGSPEANQDAD